MVASATSARRLSAEPERNRSESGHAEQTANDAGLRSSAVESDHPLISGRLSETSGFETVIPNTLASGALPSASACVGPS